MKRRRTKWKVEEIEIIPPCKRLDYHPLGGTHYDSDEKGPDRLLVMDFGESLSMKRGGAEIRRSP
jgi:hypothetical protein